MVISLVKFSDRPLLIFPDPAVISVGDKVEWQFLTDAKNMAHDTAVRWTIYFKPKEHPFESDAHEWEQEATAGESEVIEPGVANSPGHYKYGVRIVKAETDEEISDDDPLLIVQS